MTGPRSQGIIRLYMACDHRYERNDKSARRTWNTPEDIQRHRLMTPEQRLRKAIAVSRAALRLAAAGRDDRR